MDKLYFYYELFMLVGILFFPKYLIGIETILFKHLRNLGYLMFVIELLKEHKSDNYESICIMTAMLFLAELLLFIVYKLGGMSEEETYIKYFGNPVFLFLDELFDSSSLGKEYDYLDKEEELKEDLKFRIK